MKSVLKIYLILVLVFLSYSQNVEELPISSLGELKSKKTNISVKLAIRNISKNTLLLYKIKSDGIAEFTKNLLPNRSSVTPTNTGVFWVVKRPNNSVLGVYKLKTEGLIRLILKDDPAAYELKNDIPKDDLKLWLRTDKGLVQEQFGYKFIKWIDQSGNNNDVMEVVEAAHKYLDLKIISILH